MRRVDLVVFDLDGTLIDSAGDLGRSVNAALERLAPGTPPALPVFLDCYQARLLDTTVLHAGVLESLDALGDRMLAVLTNKPGDMSRRILDGLGVAGRFARICGPATSPPRNPTRPACS